jgi:hypothetical protein
VFSWQRPGAAHRSTGHAREILTDLRAGRRRSNGAFGIAVVYAGRRDYDKAFPELEHSTQENSWRHYIFTPIVRRAAPPPAFRAAAAVRWPLNRNSTEAA